MEKRFLFVNPYINPGYNTGINHGIAYLLPVLKKHSYEVSCLNISHEISSAEFLKAVLDFNPSIIGFSCTSHQIKYVIKYSTALKNRQYILQIAGGVGPTLDAESLFRLSAVTGICIGEGELPLEYLLCRIEEEKDIYETEGFYWRRNGKIIRNKIPSFITDLSILEFPDYSLFARTDSDAYGYLLVMLSRGCPLNCHHCCNMALAANYPNSKEYARVPSVEYSLKLIKRLLLQYPKTKFITFEDDLLIANKEWFNNFAEELNKKIGLPYRVCVRPELIDPSIIKVLKSSGCEWIYMGLESGNEYLRSHLLNRTYSNNLFIKKAQMIKKAKIKLYTFNIMGFPFETKEQMLDTLRLNMAVAPHAGICTFFYPYKHTKLYSICQKNNLLKSEEEMLEITNYNTKPAIKMSAVEERHCVYFQKMITCYLTRQRRRMLIKQLPFGMKKVCIVVYEYIYSTLSLIPFLYVLLKKVAGFLRLHKPRILDYNCQEN